MNIPLRRRRKPSSVKGRPMRILESVIRREGPDLALLSTYHSTYPISGARKPPTRRFLGNLIITKIIQNHSTTPPSPLRRTGIIFISSSPEQGRPSNDVEELLLLPRLTKRRTDAVHHVVFVA